MHRFSWLLSSLFGVLEMIVFSLMLVLILRLFLGKLWLCMMLAGKFLVPFPIVLLLRLSGYLLFFFLSRLIVMVVPWGTQALLVLGLFYILHLVFGFMDFLVLSLKQIIFVWSFLLWGKACNLLSLCSNGKWVNQLHPALLRGRPTLVSNLSWICEPALMWVGGLKK